MKKHIHLTKLHMISCVIILIGMIMMVSGIRDYVSVKRAVALKQLALQDLRKGMYVTGDVSVFLGKYLSDKPGSFQGSAVGYITFRTTTNYYTVPINEGKEYITLLLDETQEKKFQGINNIYQPDKAVSVTGRIVRLPVEINYEWLRSILGVKDHTQVANYVSPVYGIEPVDFRAEKMKVIYGLCVLLSGLMVLFMFGDVKHITVFGLS